MAEGEEKKNGGGDEQKKSGFPIGFRFKPTDEELVECYLLPRLQGQPAYPNDAIIEANVYEFHPDKLINDMYKAGGEDNWYFLSPRARKYQNGERPSRNTDDNRGRWKASTGRTEAKGTVGDGKTKFCESVLAYFEGPIKTEKKTKWLMHELTIPQYENKLDKSGSGGSGRNSKTLDDYVMCRIYVTPRYKGDDAEASSSKSACGQAYSSSSQPGPVESRQEGPKLSGKQAGKRPEEEQAAGRSTPAPKRPRHPTLVLGAPAYGGGGGGGGGGGMQMPRGTVFYDGRTGQPMAHNGGAPMLLPPVMYNFPSQVQRPQVVHDVQASMQRPYNGQAPVQLPQVAHNVQRSPAAYNGQEAVIPLQLAYNDLAPVHRRQVAYNRVRPPASYNGQASMQRPAAAYNCQAPVQRRQMASNETPVLTLLHPYPATPAPSGHNSFGQTTMTPPPPNSSDQTAIKPPSVQVQPTPQQRQPETDDMHRLRVFEQLVDELHWRLDQGQLPPTNAAYAAQQQQQQQQPYFNAGVNHHMGAMGPQFPPCNCYPHEGCQQYQCSTVVPAASYPDGAAPPPLEMSPSGSAKLQESVTGDCNDEGEKNCVELASTKISPDGGARFNVQLMADGDGVRHDLPH